MLFLTIHRVIPIRWALLLAVSYVQPEVVLRSVATPHVSCTIRVSFSTSFCSIMQGVVVVRPYDAKSLTR